MSNENSPEHIEDTSKQRWIHIPDGNVLNLQNIMPEAHIKILTEIQDKQFAESVPQRQAPNARINRVRARSTQASPQRNSMKEMLSRAPVE